MSLISSTQTISIIAAPTTTLAIIATAMSPKSWVQLDGVTRTVGTTPNVACTIPAQPWLNHGP